MNIFIVGSEGFIGSHLVTYYLKQGWRVSGTDLVDYPKLKYSYTKISRLSPDYDELFQKHQFDFCINAAGSGNVQFSVDHPVKDFEANVLDTIKLLDSIRKFSPKCKYLHISSAAVYGNPKKLPVHENDDCFPVSPYGWHKLASENICTQYHSIFDIPTLVIRPFSIYGPGLRKQLIWDIYHKMVEADAVELFGTGNETRDFLYIADLVHAVDVLLHNATFNAEKYNVASGEEFSISLVTSMFSSYFNEKKSLKFNQKIRRGDPLNWRADVSKLKQVGYRPEVPLNVGLERTYNWLAHE